MSALTKSCVMRNLCLLVACLMLTACATSTPQSKPPTKSSLDSALAARCPEVARPAASDFDAWQEWALGLLH
jgi:outer membrane biogenesis lipoprotein LolB